MEFKEIYEDCEIILSQINFLNVLKLNCKAPIKRFQLLVYIAWK